MCPLGNGARAGLEFPPAAVEPCAPAPSAGCAGPRTLVWMEQKPLRATCPILGVRPVPGLVFQPLLPCVVGNSPVPSYCSTSPLTAKRCAAAKVMFRGGSAGAEPP